MAVGGGDGVADAAIVYAQSVSAVVVLPVDDVSGNANNVGIAAVLAVQCKRLVGGAGVLPPVYDD